MRLSISVPRFTGCFEHAQIKPFIRDQSLKLKGQLEDRIVPLLLRGTCKVLEVVANNTADAHDYLIAKLKPKQPV